MGCSIVKRQRHIKTLDIEFSVNSESLKSYYDTIAVSLKNPSRSHLVCRKFKIPEDQPKIFKVDIIKLFTFCDQDYRNIGFQISLILKDIQNSNEVTNYFLSLLHYGCIPSFTIETGVAIFMIFCLSNKAMFSTSKHFPYIIVKEQDRDFKDLIKSWNDYIEFHENIYKDYQEVKFYQDVLLLIRSLIMKLEKYEDRVSKKILKYYKTLIDVIGNFVYEIKSTIVKIRMLVDVYERNKKMFEVIGKSAGVKELKSCSALVHLIY